MPKQQGPKSPHSGLLSSFSVSPSCFFLLHSKQTDITSAIAQKTENQIKVQRSWTNTNHPLQNVSMLIWTWNLKSEDRSRRKSASFDVILFFTCIPTSEVMATVRKQLQQESDPTGLISLQARPVPCWTFVFPQPTLSSVTVLQTEAWLCHGISSVTSCGCNGIMYYIWVYANNSSHTMMT